jgi:hypothetical protein
MESLLCGAFAGTGAKLVIYPLDMFKKRLQVRAADTHTAACR